MNLNIEIDHELEKITIVLDDYLPISAHKSRNNEIVYSKNLENVEDDNTYNLLVSLFILLFKNMENGD